MDINITKHTLFFLVKSFILQLASKLGVNEFVFSDIGLLWNWQCASKRLVISCQRLALIVFQWCSACISPNPPFLSNKGGCDAWPTMKNTTEPVWIESKFGGERKVKGVVFRRAKSVAVRHCYGLDVSCCSQLVATLVVSYLVAYVSFELFISDFHTQLFYDPSLFY